MRSQIKESNCGQVNKGVNFVNFKGFMTYSVAQL